MRDAVDPRLDGTARDSAELAAEESRFGESFHRDHPIQWWATLVGPFAATAAMLAAVLATHDLAYLQKLLVTAAATFFVFGRFVILGGVEADPAASEQLAEIHGFLTRGELFAMVVWMDVATACVLVYHQGFLFRLPFLGPRLLGLVEDGRFILKRQPWIRRATFVGLVAFVMFPLAATGSVGGAIFGRLVGLSRAAALLAIVLGSVIGCGAMYLGAGFINRHVDRSNPWLTVSGIAVVLAVIVLLNWRYRCMKRRAGEAGDRPAGTASAST
jgi:hypothetical protein